MQLHLRWRKLVVGGLGDSADQDPRTDPRRLEVGLEGLSGVCQALESVIVVRLEGSARARLRLVRKRVWPWLGVRSDLVERRARRVALLP